MPGFNVSVEQYTPLIRYTPPSAWGPGSPADSQFSKYNDGFRLTTANGSTATFNFNGTGVWYALYPFSGVSLWLMRCLNQDIWRISTQPCLYTSPYTSHFEILTLVPKGNFSVTLDGTPQGVFNGSTKDQFQVVLFGAVDLENKNHSIELTNIPVSSNNLYVDIDFVCTSLTLLSAALP